MRHLLPALLLAPLPAPAQDFHCRNTDAEIRCSAGKCEIERESFTPMELSLRGATLTICAYSGCWSGPVRMRRTYGGLVLLHAQARGSLAVIYDPRERIAQMRWGGFANAMTCG